MTDDGGGGFRGAEFIDADFTGARFHSCDLRHARIADCWLADVKLSGLVENLVVNDIDVTAFVAAELDRRHPERVQLRQVQTPDDYRAMWDTVERLWDGAIARVRRLAEAAAHERVDGEWSFVETLRHLVFATDAWAGRCVLDEPMPYHRLGLPHTDYPAEDVAAIDVDVDADPSLDEVVAVWDGRRAMMRRIVDGLTDADLERLCTRSPGPGYPEDPLPAGRCLRVVMRESCEHYRYAVRDLAVIEAGPGG